MVVFVKQNVSLEITTTSNANAYTLLVFTDTSSFSRDFTASRLKAGFHVPLRLTPGGHIVVQLFDKQYAGLNGRHSQYLVGSATMTLEPTHENLGKQHFPLKLKNYFQMGVGKSTAQCSISIVTGKLCLASFKDRLGHYTAPGHSLQAGYLAASPFIHRVSMPYYFDETTQSRIPGAAFFQFPPFARASTEQEWVHQFRKVLLRFRNPGKISNRTVAEVALEFTPGTGLPAIYLIADAVTDVVTAYPYRPDKQESFDDVFFNRGGDCEDFAKGILRTWASLERTCKSASSRFMKSVAVLIGKYQAWAILGSVRKRSFSNTDSSVGEAAHMYSMLLPRGVFRTNDSHLPRVILEGTAKVSYLAEARGVPSCKPTAPFYHLQPMSRVSEELARFYYRVARAYLPGQTEFLVVNEIQRKYGVDIRDILATGSSRPKISFLPSRKYPNEVANFIKTTYMHLQREFQQATVPKLPLALPLQQVLYEREIGSGIGGICFMDISGGESVEGIVKVAQNRGARKLTREDQRTFRME